MATTATSHKSGAKKKFGIRSIVKTALKMKDAIIEKVPGKKASSSSSSSKAKAKKATSPVMEKVQASSQVIPNENLDPAHQPGHRKLNLKDQFQEATGEKTKTMKSAQNHASRGDLVSRTTSPKRRIQGAMRTSQSRGRSGKTNSAKNSH